MHSFVETTKRNGPGLTGSALLHLLLLLLALGLVAHRQGQPPAQLPFYAVDLVRLGAGSQSPAGPPGPARLSAPAQPQQQAASLRNEALSPTGRKAPEDALDAKLKALARLAVPAHKLALDNDAGPDDDSAGGGAGGLSYAVRDFVRAQVMRRWYPDLARLAGRRAIVRLRLTMKRNGTITVADLAGPVPQGDVWRDVALSAQNAALLSSPIALPPGDYAGEMHFTIVLDTRDARR